VRVDEHEIASDRRPRIAILGQLVTVDGARCALQIDILFHWDLASMHTASAARR
jgi:hypothetical protein